MPRPDPKQHLLKMRQIQLAAQKAAQQAALSAKQQKRRMSQPEENPTVVESEAAQWVRDNLEWDSHQEIWEIPYTTSGDYVGSYLAKANAKYLLATYPDLFTSVTGAYSTETVGITEEKRLALTEDEFNTIKEIVEGLEDYPVIDDDTFSNVESEAKWEYWTEYGRDGIREALVKKFSDDFVAQLAVCLRPDQYWDDLFSEQGWDQYINQDGEGLNMYMHDDSITRELSPADIASDEDEVLAFLHKKFEAEELDNWIKVLHENGVYLNSKEEAFAAWKEAERQIGFENLWKIDRPDMQEEPGGAIELEYKALEQAAKLIKDTPTDEIVRRSKTRPDDPNQLTFKLEAKQIIEALLAEQETYRLSTTQVDLPKPLADHIIKWGRMNIKDDDLYYDEEGGCGRESEGHITVLYGLKDAKPSAELKELVRKTKPFTIRLGTVSLFESEDYDVVKISVHSDDLVSLSDAIRQACPNENKFPKYVPHATIAYVKKGRADSLKESTVFTKDAAVEPEFEATELLFKGAGAKGDPERVIVSLPFNRLKNEAVDPKRALRLMKREITRPTRLGQVPEGAIFQCDDGRKMRKVGGKTYLINPGGEETLYDINNPQYLCYPTGWDKATMGSYGRNYFKRRAQKPVLRAHAVIGEAIDPKRVMREIGTPEDRLKRYVRQNPPGRIRWKGTTKDGFNVWVSSDSAREMVHFGPFTADQMYAFADWPELDSAQWTMEAVDPKRVFRDVQTAWYAYVDQSDGLHWIDPEGWPTVAGPQAFTRQQMNAVRGTKPWAAVQWTTEPKTIVSKNLEQESARAIIEAVDPKRVMQAMRKSPDKFYPYVFDHRGHVVWLQLSGDTAMGPVGFTRRQMEFHRPMPQWQQVRWTTTPIKAYWAHNVAEARPDAKRIFRQMGPEKVWYAYVPKRYGPLWLTLSGMGSEVPVAFTGKEKADREGMSHWHGVVWVDDPKKGQVFAESEAENPTPAEIDKAAQAANCEPTDGQKECGNYAKGHITLHGFDIAIENAGGSERSGKDKDGKEWKVTMPCHYGYIKGTKGKDKDHLDVYIGKNPESEKVWIINQAKKEGGFDEHKIMLGFVNKFRAVRCYDRAFSDGLGPKLREEVIETTVQGLKDWIKSGETSKPFKLPHSPEADWLDDSLEEGLEEAEDPKAMFSRMRNPRRSITRPTYFKHVPDHYWFRTVNSKLCVKDTYRDPEGIYNAYVYDEESIRGVILQPGTECFPTSWRSHNITNPKSYRMTDRVRPSWLTPEEADPTQESKRHPFDALNFPTDASVLVSKLLDLDKARSKPVL